MILKNDDDENDDFDCGRPRWPVPLHLAALSGYNHLRLKLWWEGNDDDNEEDDDCDGCVCKAPSTPLYHPHQQAVKCKCSYADVRESKMYL